MAMRRLRPVRLTASLFIASLPLQACSSPAENLRVSDSSGSANRAAVDAAATEAVSTGKRSTPIGDVEGSATGGAAPIALPADRRSAADAPANRVYVAKVRRPVVVLGALRPGRLDVVDGCLTVKMADQAIATAVLPPDARMLMNDETPSAVAYGSRSLPIGQNTRIPGGGNGVTASDLVSKLPASCPQRLFPIGG